MYYTVAFKKLIISQREFIYFPHLIKIKASLNIFNAISAGNKISLAVIYVKFSKSAVSFHVVF